MFYKKREKFNKLSIKIGLIFSKLPLSPNQWTLISLILAILSFYFLINQKFLIALLFFFFTATIDFIDGSVARVTKKVTNLGAYLDTTIDRIVEFLMIFGLFSISYPIFIFGSQIWLLLLLFGSMMTTYVKAAAFEKQIVKKELKGGFLERSERLILLFLIILISSYSLSYASYLIVITAILTNISALQRFLIAIKR